MILPIRTDSPLRHTPWMNYALIAGNAVMFAAQRVDPRVTAYLELDTGRPAVTAFLTYAFLHDGAWHIVSNMLFLYIFGNNVNDKLGHLGYLAFYLAGAVFAGVGFAVTSGNSQVLGASGAVAAVTGAYLVLFPRSHITIVYFLFLIGTYELPSMWFILFFFVQDLIMSGNQTGVAHTAHISGSVFGFVVCFALLAASLLPRDQFDVLALAQRWNKRRQYRDAVSQGWDPFNHHRVPAAAAAAAKRNVPPPPPDPKLQRAGELRAEISQAIAAQNHPAAAALFGELKALDPQAVLSRQAQLDVANQLASQQLYPQAAEAYEGFLRHYQTFEQIEQVELMLGLIYARYLRQYDPAREYLLRALARLHNDREVSLAKAELQRIEPLAAPGRT